MRKYAPIEGHPGYIACDDGTIINTNTGEVVNGSTKRTGYIEVVLKNKEGATKSCLVHRLIATAFIGAPGPGQEVNHINGVKTDNRVENLEWVNHGENLRHAYENGLRENDVSPRRVRGTNIETGEQVEFQSIYKAARFLGISQGNICMCCRGQRPSASGYIWEYADEG